MTDKIHPVVELLAARMESHPEEFRMDGDRRWGAWMAQMEGLLTEEEKLLLRRSEMQEIHEEVLDELMNGPERRAEEKRKKDDEMQRHIAHAAAQQQAYQQSTLSQYRNAMGQYQNAVAQAIVGKSPSGIWVDEYANIGIGTQSPSQPLVIGTGKEAMRIQANGDIQIGGETLNEGLLKTIKKKLGI
jgi:hypothetical protein